MFYALLFMSLLSFFGPNSSKIDALILTLEIIFRYWLQLLLQVITNVFL